MIDPQLDPRNEEQVLRDLARAADQTLHEKSQQETFWSAARLVTFLLAFAPWLIIPSQPLLAGAAFLLLLGVFVASVLRHLTLAAARDAAARRSTVLAEAISRVGGHLVCVRDPARPVDDAREDADLVRPLPAAEAWPLTEQEREDLDCYAAPVGVFGLLNRASTRLGARRLRDVLEQPLLDADAIRDRQALIAALAEAPAPRVEIMAGIAATRREDERLRRLIRAVAETPPLRLPIPAPLLWALTLVNPLLIAGGIAMGSSGEPVWFGLTLLYGLLPWLVLRRCRPASEPVLSAWRDVSWALRAARIGAQAAVDHLPADARFDALRRPLAAAVERAALPRLAWRIAWADHSGPVQVFLDLLFFLRLHVARGIDACLQPHRRTLLEAFGALAELEMLTSLACFSAEQPVRCWPEFRDEGGIEIEDGAHPLVPPGAVVANSVRLDPQTRVWLITGSNMAGKSTLLRMTGVCTVLAQIGCAVPARAMRLQAVRLITDLRVRDNLSRAESYFLAEVRHLRRLLTPDDAGPPVLGLIDEPFRGTNSEDQSAASVAVVEYLIERGHYFLVATHDRNLTELAQRRGARNFHFRENLAHGAMVFDYRLHDGPARTRNALRILEIEGYPSEVVRRAHDWLHERTPSPVDAEGDAAQGK